MLIPSGTLILIADGTHMLLLRNQGSARRPDLKAIDHRSFTNPPNRALASDAPGIVHESAGPGRSSYEESCPHQENEDRFAIQAVQTLNEAAWLSGSSVMVVAPPRTLAILRRHYEKAVKERLIAEMDKDLIHCTIADITARILRFEPRKRSVLSVRGATLAESTHRRPESEDLIREEMRERASSSR